MKYLYLIAMLLMGMTNINAQDVLDLLEEEPTDVIATFKTTRIVNGHSIEQVHGGVLDFRINHRFGRVNSGADELFGIDQAETRLALEYGITDRIMIGVGRTGLDKIYDGFFKTKLLKQSKAKEGSPVTMSLLGEMAITTVEFIDEARNDDFNSRLYYAGSLLIARKFSEALSLQLSPTWVHRNLVETAAENNDIFALGLGGRVKISNRVTLNADYFYVPDNQLLDANTNSLSLGVDIETGGHVFQLHLTNSRAMYYNGFIGETTGDFFDGDIHFGFNISRVFTVNRRQAEKSKAAEL